jgi:hypothetical protein
VRSSDFAFTTLPDLRHNKLIFFGGNGGLVFSEVFGLRRIGRLKMEVGFGFGVMDGAWIFERDEVVGEGD